VRSEESRSSDGFETLRFTQGDTHEVLLQCFILTLFIYPVNPVIPSENSLSHNSQLATIHYLLSSLRVLRELHGEEFTLLTGVRESVCET